MRYSFRIIFESLAYGARGSVSTANSWAAILGAVILFVLVRLGLHKDVVIPEGVFGLVETALLCLGAAWVVIFAGRLIYSPIHLVKLREATIAEREREISTLRLRETSPFEILFNEKNPFVMAAFSEEEGAHQVGCISITNDSNQVLENCRVRIKYKNENIETTEISHRHAVFDARAPFVLIPDDGVLVPIFYQKDKRFATANDYLMLHNYVETDKGWEKGAGTPILPPGSYDMTIEILSANVRRTTILLKLNYDDGWKFQRVY